MLYRNNVKALRRQHGWSQSDLEARVSEVGGQLSFQAISLIERGVHFASGPSRIALARAFGVHPSAVFPASELDAAVPELVAGGELSEWRAPSGRPSHKKKRQEAATAV